MNKVAVRTDDEDACGDTVEMRGREGRGAADGPGGYRRAFLAHRRGARAPREGRERRGLCGGRGIAMV